MHFDDAPMLEGGSRLGQLPEIRRDPIGILRRISQDPGDILRVRMLPGNVLGLVSSPSHLHDVLVARAKSFEKSPVLRIALEPLAGQGLFTSEGELWRRQRKLMAPMFQPQQLEHYADCMRACAEQAADTWKEGAVIDVARETTRITMSVAGRTLFDTDTFGEADELGAAITAALQFTSDQSFSGLVVFQGLLRTGVVGLRERLPEKLRATSDDLAARLLRPILLPGERTRRIREALRFLDRRVERMIAERRAAGLTRGDLLTRLLQARDEEDGSRMSDKQIRDEILTLFIAGHETTASGLAWAFYLLSIHAEARRRVRAEVDALGGRPVTLADVPRLPYSLAIFKESLRLYPPIYAFGRQAIEDVEVGDYLVPKGTVLLISPYVVHHRRDLWPDPERFDPDRFTPEAEAARPRLAFLPFSAGPRTCIGNHFALMEGPIVLATLLQRADLDYVGDAPVEPDMLATLRPKGGIAMRVRARPHG